MRCATYLLPHHIDLQETQERISQEFTATFFEEALCLNDQSHRFLFIFNYGSLAFWNFTQEDERTILQTFCSEKVKAHDISPEIFAYSYGKNQNMLQDHITINKDVSDTLQMLTVSYGLSQSAVLASFEQNIEQKIKENAFIPKQLARYGKISLSRKEIAKKIGEIFLERNLVNLHTDLLDTPAFMWDHPTYDKLYHMAIKDLDLQARTEVLNTRMNILRDLFEVMSNTLNTRHSALMEWIIITLISVEVILTLLIHVFHILH